MSVKLKRISIALAATLTIVTMVSIFTNSTYGQAELKQPPSVEQAQIFLDYGELIAMPRTTVYAELDCFGSFVDSGYWTGVRLGYLLEKSGLTQQAMSVEFYASDGYLTSMPYSEAMRDDVIVAYEKDGSSLLEVTRLVIPNTNGAEWISKINQIKIVFPSGSSAYLYLK